LIEAEADIKAVVKGQIENLLKDSLLTLKDTFVFVIQKNGRVRATE
jgi:uncharacterized membrane protein